MDSLGQKIASALTGNPTVSELGVVLGEAVDTLNRKTALLQDMEAATLDPLLSTDEARQKRGALEDERFNLARLQSSVTALDTRLDELQKAERIEKERAAFELALERQVAAAERLRERYPVLATELASILQECREADRLAANLTGKHCAGLAGWPGIVDPLAGVKLPMPDAARRYHWPIR